ncbi:MAG: FGGY-family carbohydrate kinase, partial [Pseudomonadota bacterium]
VAGTLNLDWVIMLVAPELAGKPDLFLKITEIAASSPPGANGVTYLPYLSESGIIAPVADPTARAQFSGLHAGHNRADIIRSVYEGVAFALAELVDLLATSDDIPITLTGGGSRSSLWCQIIADVTRRAIAVPDGFEMGARGAALLAATSLGHFDSVVSASDAMAGRGTRFAPAPDAEELWATPRARYAARRERLLA